MHAAECVGNLPAVFDVNIKPWINPDKSDADLIISTIKKCPSGALSYFMNDAEDESASSLETKVEVMENGPLLVYGTLKVTHKNGDKETKNKTTAFCRCGASANKPYCDGAHVKNDFRG